MRIVVLASGRGSNLEALLHAERSGALPATIVAVLSDKPKAIALDIARAAQIEAIALNPRDYGDRRAFDEALFERVAQLEPDLIVLAGFMRVIDAAAVTPWLGRMINIHPSLLPKYPGLHTHQRALDAGDSEHGASVHFVTVELDGGPVIAYSSMAIKSDDTANTLAERLLPVEHHLLTTSVQMIASGRLAWGDSGPLLDGLPLSQPIRI